MSPLNIAVTLHVLAVIVWVGGMFFAHLALRPAANELLEPAQRLPLIRRSLDHFFRWVIAAIVIILVTGVYAIKLGVTGGYVHAMSGLGILMMLLFGHIYFAPYRKMGKALAANDLAEGARQLGKLRLFILINLILGLITVVIGALKPF